MNDNQITATIDKQRTYFASFATRDYSFRLNALKTFRKAILAYEERFYEALNKDFRKSRFESYETELGIVLEEIGWHIWHLKKMMKPEKVRTGLAHFHSKSFIMKEPYGVVLIVSPWNYPVNLLLTPLAGVIAAGNCAVLKPADYTPHTSKLIAEMIGEYFSPEFISVFTGGRAVNQALLEERYDYIFFTGSPSLGKIVMEKASRYLTPVSLELGGKSPCIVDADADITIAARRIVWGKFLNNGQTCVAPDYLFAHRSVKARLIEELKKEIHYMYGDDPKKSPDLPRVVNKKQLDHLMKFLGHGDIVEGGTVDESELYIAPTIIDNVKPEYPVMQEEIFGPVFPVMEFSEIDEVIRYVNSNPKPLAFYYFSNSRARQKYVLSHTSSGGGCINDTIVHLANNHMPFGGVGNSGMGGYHGKYSFDTFSHKRSILKKSIFPDLKIRYAPYGDKLKILKMFLK
ncbi:MAG TPA: aldehyde dehydrogenase [Spirochaetota bacterium]|nr:aldehyde dehydrogenase [Spirochaetota bacterium]